MKTTLNKFIELLMLDSAPAPVTAGFGGRRYGSEGEWESWEKGRALAKTII